MRTRSCGPWVCAVAIALVAACLPPAALAQNQNGNLSSIPTLDGVGLATLAGALSIGGAWLLARNRDKRK